MPTEITLLEKVYGRYSLNALDNALTPMIEGLDAHLKFVGKTNRGWIKAEVSGEDETVALNQLREKMGFAPESITNIRRFLTVRGRVIFSGRKDTEICVDVGVFSPEVFDAVVPLENLQAQLADGKKMPLKQLTELFCLYDNTPLRVKIIDCLNGQSRPILAEISEAQIAQFTSWIRSSLDRLIVFCAPSSYVRQAIGKSKLTRDIIAIEELGVLEHSLVCKLGTDAVGLIPKLGPLLPAANFASFSPRKIQKLIRGRFTP